MWVIFAICISGKLIALDCELYIDSCLGSTGAHPPNTGE